MRPYLRDLRHGLRTLLKSPSFAVPAILCLAIGIGGSTAIFSITNALLLQPLPYKDSDRLAILWNRSPGLGITQDWFSTAQYFDIKASHSFEDVAIAIGGNYNLSGTGDPLRVGTIKVSSNLLTMLGARPLSGRLFVPEEDVAGGPFSAVLSYGMWMRRFGGDPHVLGKSIIMNGQSCQVVGVLPRRFSLPREVLPTLGGAEQAEILLNLPLSEAADHNRDHEDYNVIAKLKRGVSVSQAQAEMNTITAGLRRNFPQLYPPNGGLTFGVLSLNDQVVGDARRIVLILLAAVGFVFLISCANVANLVLSRATIRRKEIAIRTALGASRTDVVRQLLAECVLLGLIGGALGTFLAWGGLKAIQLFRAPSIPRMDDFGIDFRVLLFTFALSLISSVLFGLVPTLRISRLDPSTVMKEAGGISAGTSRFGSPRKNARRLLVCSEIALSAVLLIGAQLLIRSFWQLQNVPPGFNSQNVLTMGLTMTGHKYADSKSVAETYRQFLERLEHLPGVTSAGASTALPLSEMFAWGPITVEGRVPLPGENFINADERFVAGHYFEAMQIPLLAGRFFNETDGPDFPHVAIIDDFMAAQLWPGESALGKRIRLGDSGSNSPWVTVVGVVGRVKQYTLDSDSRIAFYLAHKQFPIREMNVVVRSAADPQLLRASISQELHSIDPDIPLYSVRTMRDRVTESLARRRFTMLLLAVFAGVALLLAAVGIYGLLGYWVNQSTREIGIRMAIGATRASVVLVMLRRALAIAIPGILIGIAAAFALTRSMESLLFGIAPTDPFTFSTVSIFLLVVTMCAAYIPSRRASRVNPIDALRQQ
jgi:predicted permease